MMSKFENENILYLDETLLGSDNPRVKEWLFVTRKFVNRI